MNRFMHVLVGLTASVIGVYLILTGELLIGVGIAAASSAAGWLGKDFYR